MTFETALKSPVVAATPLLEARGLCKFYGTREVLHAVDFSIAPREIVTIVGPNGAGKTTLLKCLLGLDMPDFGSIARADDLRIGYVPQHFHPQPSLPLTVESFLQLYGSCHSRASAVQTIFGLGNGASSGIQSSKEDGSPMKLCGKKPKWFFGKANSGMTVSYNALVEKLAVAHLLKQQLSSLSGGELRRVLLLRALLNTPNLLVLDEPTAGVDVGGQGELYRLLKTLSEELGFAVLMVSHDLYVVMAAAERVVCLNHHVCCEGTPQQVGGDASFRAMFGDTLADQVALYHHHHTHSHGLGDEDYPHEHHAPDHGHHHHEDDDDETVTHYHHHACCNHDR